MWAKFVMWLLGNAVKVEEKPPESQVLLDIMKSQMEHASRQQLAQTELMKQVVGQMSAQAAAFQSMVDLWKPPAREPSTSSMDDRLNAKEMAVKSDWVPIGSPEDFFKMLDKDIPFRDMLDE